MIARKAAEEKQLSRLDAILDKLPVGDEGFLVWTPKVRDLVGEIAQLQRQLDTLARPFFKEPTAALICAKIKNFQYEVSDFPAPLEEFRQAAHQWLALAEQQYHEVQDILSRARAPQVFQPSLPVERREEAFVLRERVLGELEQQLTLNTGCPGLLLYGRRRMGKSTLLQNLKGFLPSSVRIITVSLQSAQYFTNQTLLLNQLAKTLLQSCPLPDWSLPELVDLVGFSDLLGTCNERLAAQQARLLLALDEYEYLDRKLDEGVFTEELLAMFRDSMQYHRQLTWIFAGSHAITELNHAPWPSYLIGVLTLEVPPFTEAETRLLLTEPLKYSPEGDKDDLKRPRFEPLFWGEGGIERIHVETGGWPNLVQLLAHTLVNLRNEQGKDRVDALLLEQGLSKAVMLGDVVLAQLLKAEDAAPEEWTYLRGFRTRDTQPLPADEAVYQALRRRLLVEPVNGEWRLRVPLMQRWLRERG